MSHEEWSAVKLSLWVATTATLLSLPFGIAVGYGLARARFRGKWLLETLVSLPLVLPPVVTGYALLLLFGQQGWIGRHLYAWLGIRIVFTWQAATIAAAVMAFPLMVRAIRIAIANVDRRLEQAARVSGAGPLEAFVRITLPLAKRGVIAGALLGFARSLGEFGATIMIAGNIAGETQTLPLYIYSLVNAPGGFENSYRMVLVAVGFSMGALLIAEYLERGWQSKREERDEP